MRNSPVSTKSILGLILLVSCLGCGGSKSVKGTPRPESNTPVLGFKDNDATSNGNSLDLSFLNEDHFGCFKIDVSMMLATPQFSEVPWDVLEDQLATWVGSENSQLKNIRRAWVVLDRSMLGGNEETENTPGVLILDYLDSYQIQPVEFGEAEGPGTKTTETATGDARKNQKFGAVIIGQHRIALGNPMLTASLTNNDGVTELAMTMKRMKLNSAIEGVISFGPIRKLLESVFGIAVAYGGDSFAPFAQLPELLQQVEIKVDFDSELMLSIDVFIDDDEIAQALTKVLDSSSTTNGSPLANLNAFGRRPNDTPSMLPNRSMAFIAKIASEIQEERLFSVEAKSRQIEMRLKRPRDTGELVQALIVDWKRQVNLGRRINNLKTIAAALKAYEEKHGCLPASGQVGLNEDGLPRQFNWRVGLLPLLGKQTLYDQFDFDQPWDSRLNLKVAQEIPDVFSFGDAAVTESARTRFHVIGGEFGVFKNDNGPQLSEISDERVSTALLIEGSPDSAVVWTEPGAMKIEEPTVESFGNEDETGVLVVTAKFRPRIVKRDREAIRAVLSPAGGEKLRRDQFLKIPAGLNQ